LSEDGESPHRECGVAEEGAAMRLQGSWGRLEAVVVAGALAAACATARPPTLRVQALDFGRVGVTGAAVNVSFQVRNVNPEPLLIERFEYELEVNGHRLGHGYYPDPVRLDGFGEERVVSRFDLNFLRLPGAVKAVLEEDRARARARGRFFVRKGGSLEELKFDSDAEVRIGR
jgi:LEA14-like dessication related protein